MCNQLRDAAYDLVAKHRYRLFGRTEACQVPDLDFLERFIDRDELELSRHGKNTDKPDKVN
jgi:hypothetical protein